MTNGFILEDQAFDASTGYNQYLEPSKRMFHEVQNTRIALLAACKKRRK
jgi:hypothetical protein